MLVNGGYTFFLQNTFKDQLFIIIIFYNIKKFMMYLAKVADNELKQY